MFNVFSGKFITLAEFTFLEPMNVFHREGEKPVDERKHPEKLKNLHITFRAGFMLDGLLPKKVLVRFSADDYAKISVNGKFAGQGPAQGYYFDYNWVEVDITDRIVSGYNLIEADVYYQGLINRAYNSGDLRCGFICDIVDETGKVLISTDENWYCRVDHSYIGTRRTGYETQYLEDRDLRKAPGEWEHARVKDADYTFAEKSFPMLDVHELKPSASLTRFTGDGEEKRVSVIYDFGREVVGTCSLIIHGHAGDVIELRAAEELMPDDPSDSLALSREGVLTPETQIRWKTRANCEYSETATLNEGENVIDQYEYKAFRYAEVIYPYGDVIIRFHAVERHYPMKADACVLYTSDKVLQQVFELCKHGVRLCAQEVFVDCPGREKGQYAGDLTISSASQIWLTGDMQLFCKAVKNQMESAFIDEGLMAVTPGSFMQEIADYSLQFPILALRYYDLTGDRKGLTELLGVCEKLVAYFEPWKREDGLLDGMTGKWNLVDWPANLRDNYDFPLTIPIGKGVHNVMNALYIGAILYTEKIAEILRAAYSHRSGRLIEAYNRCFWREELGLYADSETSMHASLHSNVLPSYFGFAKPEVAPKMVEVIRERSFSGGVYMSYFTMKVLARLGLYGDIWNMITSEGESSWYNMVREGGTSCFEAWGKNKKWNTSLCHAWASAPVTVLIEDILGITPKKPGYADVNVCPHIPETVEHLSMRIPLVSGKHVEFEWKNGSYRYQVL